MIRAMHFFRHWNRWLRKRPVSVRAFPLRALVFGCCAKQRISALGLILDPTIFAHFFCKLARDMVRPPDDMRPRHYCLRAAWARFVYARPIIPVKKLVLLWSGDLIRLALLRPELSGEGTMMLFVCTNSYLKQELSINLARLAFLLISIFFQFLFLFLKSMHKIDCFAFRNFWFRILIVIGAVKKSKQNLPTFRSSPLNTLGEFALQLIKATMARNPFSRNAEGKTSNYRKCSAKAAPNRVKETG